MILDGVRLPSVQCLKGKSDCENVLQSCYINLNGLWG